MEDELFLEIVIIHLFDSIILLSGKTPKSIKSLPEVL